MRNTCTLGRRGILAGLGALALALSMSGHLRAETLPLVTVTKDPSCGCCNGWVEHIEAAGFPVRVLESADMFGLKQRRGVPAELASCHTADVGGYVIEGHVPAAAVKRLLTGRPAGVGLAWTFHWYYGVLFFVGGLLGWWLEKKHPQLSQEFTFPVASGWIAGESLMGVALVLWENGPELVRRLVGR